MDDFEHCPTRLLLLRRWRQVSSQITLGTQDAVATAFTNQYEGRFTLMAWFQWTGKHWASDTTKQILHKIRELARESNPNGKAANASAHFSLAFKSYWRQIRS